VDVATGALTNVGQMSPALLLDISEAPAVSLGPPEVLDVTRAQVVVDFKKKDRDTATIVGLIDVPQGGWAGKKLQVDFGGIVREFVLDGGGRGTSGADTFRIAPRPKKGGWQFTLKLGKGRFAKQLGLDADQPIGSVDVVLDLFVTDPAEELFFGPAAHRSQFRMDYFVRRNGRATATRREN
jgi:hypothetical protein